MLSVNIVLCAYNHNIYNEFAANKPFLFIFRERLWKHDDSRLKSTEIFFMDINTNSNYCYSHQIISVKGPLCLVCCGVMKLKKKTFFVFCKLKCYNRQ